MKNTLPQLRAQRGMTQGDLADALNVSRSVLNDYGNMSSGTVMFVLDRIMREAAAPGLNKETNKGRNGCAMSFGPGLVAETMMFRMAA